MFIWIALISLKKVNFLFSYKNKGIISDKDFNNTLATIKKYKITDSNLLEIILSSNQALKQIEAKKRCEKKLPTWFNTANIYYPNKLNIEQTSSETTANYKADLVSGNSLIDLTGGFGVDTYYFAKAIESVTHCEINDEQNNRVYGDKILLGFKDESLESLKVISNGMILSQNSCY